MAKRQNPFQHIATELTREISVAHKKARESDIIPFGYEEVSARDARTRLSTMTRADLEAMPPDAYQKLVDTVGVQGIMQVLMGSKVEAGGQEQQPGPGMGMQQPGQSGMNPFEAV